MNKPYRRKHFLDSEIRPPENDKKWNLKLVGLWAGGTALLCVLAALLWLVATRARPAVSREEFTEAVMGKTKDEVIRTFGEALSSGNGFLHYSSRTYDKNALEADKITIVTFDAKTGQCVKVDFMP